MPAFTPQLQSTTALCLVLISRPTEGKRLSWPDKCFTYLILTVKPVEQKQQYHTTVYTYVPYATTISNLSSSRITTHQFADK